MRPGSLARSVLLAVLVFPACSDSGSSVRGAGGAGHPDAGSGTGGTTSAGGTLADASAGGTVTSGGTTAAGGALADASADSGVGPNGIVAPDRMWTWVEFPDSFCRDGSTAGLAVSLSSTSSRVMIYLGGGGACFDTVSCLVNPPNTDGQRGEQRHGLFDRKRPENPVRDFSFVYVPYCSGDLHAGANPNGTDADPQKFVGYSNITAFLKRLVPTFPGATQVLLTGIGPGGIGALANMDQVQAAFGSVPVTLLDDSGSPLSSTYVAPCFQKQWRLLWGLDASILKDCGADCPNPDDFLMSLATHVVSRHSSRNIGLIDATSDAVENLFYGFGVNGCNPPPITLTSLPSLPAGALSAGLSELRTAFGGSANFTTYYADSGQQSWLAGEGLYDASVGSTRLVDWVRGVVDGPLPGAVGPGAVTFDTGGPAVVTGSDGGASMACNGDALLCDRPFDQVVFPAAHNAMQDFDSGRLLPNQTHGIPQQLEDGIRMFLIDSYDWNGASNLCHGVCDIGNELLVNVLVQMRRFMDQNPNEVLSILFEDYISSTQTVAAFTAAGLDKYAYAHPPGTPWPTLRQMINSGQRLLVMAQTAGPPPAWYQHGWNLMWETPYTFATTADFSCTAAPEGGPSTNDLFLLNHWLSNPTSTPTLAATANAYSVLLGRAQQCQAASGKLPNFIAVDDYSIGDLFKVVRTMNGLP